MCAVELLHGDSLQDVLGGRVLHLELIAQRPRGIGVRGTEPRHLQRGGGGSCQPRGQEAIWSWGHWGQREIEEEGEREPEMKAKSGIAYAPELQCVGGDVNVAGCISTALIHAVEHSLLLQPQTQTRIII